MSGSTTSRCTDSGLSPVRTNASPMTHIDACCRCSAPPCSASRQAFANELDRLKDRRGTKNDLDLDEDDLRGLVATYKQLILDHTGREFPQDPREQLTMAVAAVFDSWNTERAVLYRRQERISGDLGTAVNICAMVYGNGGDGLRQRRRVHAGPCLRRAGVYGDYLQDAQGEDVVAGIRNTVPLAGLEQIDKASYDQLLAIMAKLEGHYRDLCDIEFTIEHGRLWILQTRIGKRTAEAPSGSPASWSTRV